MLTNLLDNLKDRGPWGNPKYRGNASGWPLYHLIQFFKPKFVSDFMVGGGATKDVCVDLGVDHHVSDLNPAWGGFDLLNDEIPCSSDLIWFHPPYNRKDGGIILYSGNMWGREKHASDLSHMPWDEYLKALNKCLAKQYASLRTGGRLAMLIGDCRQKGKLYSAVFECHKYGELEHVMIKKQENCTSDRTMYSGRFIPIVTEWLLVFRKTHHYVVDGKKVVAFQVDLRKSTKITWRDVVYSALEALGGAADLEALYKEIKNHAKAQKNRHWQAKVRQTLQRGQDFFNVKRGVWALVHKQIA